MGHTQIAITGHSNVGKTILAAQMHGRARDLDYEVPPRSPAVEVEAVSAGDWSRLVRVIPGESKSRSEYIISNLQNNSDMEGVIHVVDFGFTAPRELVSRHVLIDKDKVDTIDKLRLHNMKLEVDNLKELLIDLRRQYAAVAQSKWLVVAVNKVDLFASDRMAALAHYHPHGTSEFSKALNSFWQEIGTNNIDIYVLQSCAYEKDFDWNGESVPSSLARREQNEILSTFVQTIATISAEHS